MRSGRSSTGALTGEGENPTALFIRYVIGGGIMILGGIIEVLLGINAEAKSLETVTKPLAATDERASALVPDPVFS